MQVKEAMSNSCKFIDPEATLQDAARQMRELDCGFLPIGNESRGRLEGVITDRDIVIRAIAAGEDPGRAQVRDWQTQKILYCFETDDLQTAANSMRNQQVLRLIVLDSPGGKQLRGVLSLGDIARHEQRDLAADALVGLSAKAA